MTLAFVPGFMTDQTLWDDCVEGFLSYGPLRHIDTTKDASIEAMASRALHELSGPFILVGFSFGGYIAREIARLAPECVQALVLIGTSARASGGAHRGAPDLAQSRFTGLSRRSIEQSLHPEHISDAIVERIRAMSLRLGGQVFQRQSTVRRSGDHDRLKEIVCPTLIVAARGDRLRSLEEAQELHSGIPAAEIAIIEGSGHMIPIEVPQKLLPIVTEWLQKQDL